MGKEFRRDDIGPVERGIEIAPVESVLRQVAVLHLVTLVHILCVELVLPPVGAQSKS